jgi:threonine/homoserine/homoserine lactone efflux protein
MPSIETLLTFTLAAIILNLSPGPSNFYVMTRSIGQEAKGGVVAAFGLAFGLMVHVIASALGLSAIFTYSPMMYVTVKVCGAMYLIFLGLSYWKNKDNHQTMNDALKSKSNFIIFKESVFVEVTNPKTALFFLAFLPHFVSPDSGPIAAQIIVLGTRVTISAIPCDIMVAISSDKMANWLIKNKKSLHIQERVSGSVLIGMGSYIIADEAMRST